jgi:ABC-type histidine transport system ATPase subunit
MPVNTVNVELSIAKSHYVGWMHVTFLQNIITEPKFKLLDLENPNTK